MGDLMPRCRREWGVDLSGGRLIAVQAAGVRSGRSSDLPPNALLAAPLPAYAGIVQRLSVRMPSRRKARAVMPSVLDVELPFPIETCTCVFFDWRRTEDGGQSALAVAARNEDLAAWLERCRAAGIDPIVLEHEGVALWRASEDLFPPSARQDRFIVYLGADRIALARGNRAGLAAATGLRMGAEDLAPNSPAIHRLAVWRGEQGAAGEGGTPHIIWCGPAAATESARAAIRAALFPGIAPREICAPEPESFLARALAEGWRRGSSSVTNLRRGSLAHPEWQRRERVAGLRAAAAFAASAFLFAAVGHAGSWAVARERDAWQTRLLAEARQLAGTDRLPRGQEAFAALRAAERDAAGWAAFARYREASASAILFRAVTAAASLGIHLEDAAAAGRAITLRGSLADWNDGDRLAAALANMGLRPSLERRDAGADERIHFILRAEP